VGDEFSGDEMGGGEISICQIVDILRLVRD